jgi:hypothetical protein
MKITFQMDGSGTISFISIAFESEVDTIFYKKQKKE